MPYLKGLPDTWVVKIQQVAIRGTPDILMCVAGHFVALELKTDIGRIDKLQVYTLEAINNAKGYALVVAPSNWQKTYEFLQELSTTKIKRLKHEL